MALRLQDLLFSQHHAALTTLQHCIDQCPDYSWNQNVGHLPVSTAAFHTLFWTDMYLELNPDQFEQQEFHKANTAVFGEYEELKPELQTGTYEKTDVVSYLNFCFEKAEQVILSETEESLAAKSGFNWLECSRAEVHVYSTRHIQHHAAQISLRLRINNKIDIPWVKGYWQD